MAREPDVNDNFTGPEDHNVLLPHLCSPSPRPVTPTLFYRHEAVFKIHLSILCPQILPERLLSLRFHYRECDSVPRCICLHTPACTIDKMSLFHWGIHLETLELLAVCRCCTSTLANRGKTDSHLGQEPGIALRGRYLGKA